MQTKLKEVCSVWANNLLAHLWMNNLATQKVKLHATEISFLLFVLLVYMTNIWRGAEQLWPAWMAHYNGSERLSTDDKHPCLYKHHFYRHLSVRVLRAHDKDSQSAWPLLSPSQTGVTRERKRWTEGCWWTESLGGAGSEDLSWKKLEPKSRLV